MNVDQRRRLRDLLDRVDYEVIPLSGALEKASSLPRGSTVTITASPSRGLEATIDLAVSLAESGYRAVPHLAARMIEDRSHLQDLVDALMSAGVTQVFVIGGDPQPVGPYQDAGSLLRDMVELGHPFTEVGIAGYPEGHPWITQERLLSSLREKAETATYVVTQMCFDPIAVAGWVETIRHEGIGLPVKLGVPGVVDPVRLMRIATRIGVGDSLRMLAKQRGWLRFLRPGRYRPDRLITRVAEIDVDLDGLHLYTFNQVATSSAWREDWLARVG